MTAASSEPTAADGGHYFADDPDVASRPRSIDLVLPDGQVTLTTDRGVFSVERIDAGTKLLLMEHGIAPPGALTVCDLGCGYGPIAVTLARRHPAAAVWAIDVNERARQLTQQNAEALGLTNVTVAAPDDVPDDVRFDFIASNPPIRIGKPALHALLERWLGRLSPGGSAELVVQRHLGSDSLAKWLTAQGWTTTRLRSRAGYRVLAVAARDGGEA